MTATARKPRASWRDLPDDEDSEIDLESDTEASKAVTAKASQREWDDITREVREEKRKRFAETEFASGRRDVVAGYEDVADEAVEPDPPRPPPRDGADADSESGEEAASPRQSSPAAAEESRSAPEVGGAASSRSPRIDGESAPAESEERPEGVVTAGQQEKTRKRGGKKKTGSQKKRKDKEGSEDGEGRPKRRKTEDDEDDTKWLKVKLEGEEKAKRIKATRLVYYHDFDSGGALFGNGSTASASSGSAAAGTAPTQEASVAEAAPSAGESTAAPALEGNFRSRLRWDLYDDDSEE